jgi:5-methyltetrahydropteroyltriglutamate--homocysteine methyltransferase
MVASSVLGFPRIGERLFFATTSIQSDHKCAGPNREVKKAVEAYWAGKLSVEELEKAASDVRKETLQSLKAQGVDFIPRHDPFLLDHVGSS